MVKKVLAFALALMLTGLFAACGGNEDISQSLASSRPASVPASSSMPPEPEPEPLNQAYLTGYAKDADYPEGKRITGVMLNNVPDARPQNGISEAQILVEIKVEYEVTRMMALFQDYSKIPTTGGLRSARDQFFQLLIPTWGFYVHEGPAESTHPVNHMIREYEYQEFDITRSYSGFFVNTDHNRSTKSYSWYNLSAEGIEAAINARGLDDYRSYSSPFFDFWSYKEPPRVPQDGATSTVEVYHTPGYVSYFDYDTASGRYGMSMNDGRTGRRVETTDGNTGQQVYFDNVVVVFAPMTPYPDSILPKVDYGVGGVGYYFTQGGWEMFIWRKGPANYPLLLYKVVNGQQSDEMIKVNPGTTYLGVVDDDHLENFDTALRTGSMGQSSGGVASETEGPED